MTIWLTVVLTLILISFAVETAIAVFNIKALNPELPDEFKNVYSEDEYKKSQNYTRVTTRLSLIENSVSTLIATLFLILGGFNYVDQFARSFNFGEIFTGIIFTGSLGLLSFLVGLPFSIYSTFNIEDRFGFNKTTLRTFILDILKGMVLSIIFGGTLLAVVFWFFIHAGPNAWIYCWVSLAVFLVVMQFLVPILILPLFNKFTPVEEGLLKEKISFYANQEKFTLQGIFTMDGSKRSSKLNAFFTGFGRFRKIVFYDTLVEKLDDEEILAVLAHEMGHFKLGHMFKLITASIFQIGFMLYLLSFFLRIEGIAEAFGMAQPAVYSSLIFFGFLYSPINLFVAVIFNIFSRKYEFEADSYAAKSTGTARHLISSLKKLSSANLTNLTPHPLHVFFHYSHPPLVDRLKNLKRSEKWVKMNVH